MTDKMTGTRSEEALIERDIERTQDEMGETIHKLEESFTPGEVARSVMGDENSDLAKEMLEIARQNPVPVAMIAVGAIWLLASSQSPAIRRLTGRFRSGGPSSRGASADLRPRSAEPAPIGPPPVSDPRLDRMPSA